MWVMSWTYDSGAVRRTKNSRHSSGNRSYIRSRDQPGAKLDHRFNMTPSCMICSRRRLPKLPSNPPLPGHSNWDGGKTVPWNAGNKPSDKLHCHNSTENLNITSSQHLKHCNNVSATLISQHHSHYTSCTCLSNSQHVKAVKYLIDTTYGIFILINITRLTTYVTEHKMCSFPLQRLSKTFLILKII